LLGVVATDRDGLRLAEAAKLLHVKAPMITVLADQLIKRGLIRREQHQFDGRAKLLVLTPQGKKLVAVVEQTVSQQLQRLLTGLSSADMATYHKVLTTIIANDASTAQ